MFVSPRIFFPVICFGLLAAACAARPSPTPSPTESTAPASPAPAEVGGQTTATVGLSPTPDPFLPDRLQMVEDTIEARGVTNPDVLRVMRAVPRHAFVPHEYLDAAYADHPLPIGYGQTISQPYIVAWMTELLDLQPGDKVLEIGTGSGYQAAVLAELGFVEVYSIEIIPELAAQAAERLRSLGYADVQLKEDDGYYGWEAYAPFDAIIVTAAPDHLPSPLVAQIADGGRIVIPIGPPGGYQTLWKFVKEKDDVKAYSLGGVAFVPFTGEGVEQGPEVPMPLP
jgi:protein-L-isoaspartate(D-aspartate) O-methyltransferase